MESMLFVKELTGHTGGICTHRSSVFIMNADDSLAHQMAADVKRNYSWFVVLHETEGWTSYHTLYQCLVGWIRKPKGP